MVGSLASVRRSSLGFLAAVAVAVALASLLFAPGAGAADTYRRCGEMHGADHWKARISATHMTCRRARHILRYWFNEGPGVHYHPTHSEWWTLDRYPGWRCGFGAGGGGCSKGRRSAGYASLY